MWLDIVFVIRLEFRAMDVTKPYKFIGFGAMDVTKPHKFTRFGAMDVTKPYNFIGFGAMGVTKPYKFIGFRPQQLGPSIHPPMLPWWPVRPYFVLFSMDAAWTRETAPGVARTRENDCHPDSRDTGQSLPSCIEGSFLCLSWPPPSPELG